MNSAEFTEEFYLERFKAGEPAINCDGLLLTFSQALDERIIQGITTYSNNRTHKWLIDITTYTHFHRWRMKPRSEDEWIKHDGGESPIPWAKAGEYEVKDRNGLTAVVQSDASLGPIWMHNFGETDVIAWRLTNGWIPVIGKMPAEISNANEREWEWKNSNGQIMLAQSPRRFYNFAANSRSRIVAVRLIKQDKPIEDDEPPERLNEDGIPILGGIPFDILEDKIHKDIGVTREARAVRLIKQDQRTIPTKYMYVEPLTLAEIRARKSQPNPIRSIMKDIEGIVADVRDEKRERGPLVECVVLSKLMR